MGYDSNNNLYSVSDLHCNNKNRLSHGYGYVWAAEIQQSKRHFQADLKPTLLVSISYYDVQRWIDQKLNAFRSTVSSIANSVVNGAKSALNATINAVSRTANNAYNKATQLASSISSSVSSALSQAKSYADSAVRVAKSSLDYAINSVRSTASSAYNKAMEVANSVGYKVSNAISTAKSYADSAVNTAKSALNTAINSVKSTASSAYNKALEVANSVGSKISSAISTAKSYADSAVNTAKSALNTAINSVKSTASSAYNKALEVANSVGSKISSAISTAKSYADSAVNTAKNALNTAINAVKSTAADAYSMAQNVAVRFGLVERNLKLEFSDKIRAFENKVKPFTDFIKNINDTVKNIVSPILEPFKKAIDAINTTVSNAVNAAVKPFNDFIKGFNDKINGFLKPIIDKINNLPKELLKQALQQAKDHFKGILDNFKSGIDTIKGTIDSIIRNINELLAFRKETNTRLSNLESRLNAVASTYVTKVEFISFKTDVDKRIKLLNTAVSSINTDLKGAFQSFNLSLIDTSNKVVAAINAMNVNMGNLFSLVNDKLNSIISLLTDLNSDNGLFSKISKLFENATLLSKLDNIKLSIDNLSKKDIFDNAIFKGIEKFFAANKINDISNNLKQLLDKFTQYIDAFNATAQNIFMLYSYDIIFEGYFDKITFKFDKLLSKFDDLIKTVKEIELPKDENNTTINKEAETNFWDVLKEAVKTLAEFIKNPARILELVFDFLRSLIVPGNLDGLNSLKTNFDSNVNRKFSFVGQFKHNFVDIYSSPRTFDDITINGSGLFSGSFTIPLSLINIFAPYVKALANGFLVLAFLQSCYVWYHKKFKLESSD